MNSTPSYGVHRIMGAETEYGVIAPSAPGPAAPRRRRWPPPPTRAWTSAPCTATPSTTKHPPTST